MNPSSRSSGTHKSCSWGTRHTELASIHSVKKLPQRPPSPQPLSPSPFEWTCCSESSFWSSPKSLAIIFLEYHFLSRSDLSDWPKTLAVRRLKTLVDIPIKTDLRQFSKIWSCSVRFRSLAGLDRRFFRSSLMKACNICQFETLSSIWSFHRSNSCCAFNRFLHTPSSS